MVRKYGCYNIRKFNLSQNNAISPTKSNVLTYRIGKPQKIIIRLNK